MRSFEHLTVASLEEALAALGGDWQTRMIAGGTDLVPLMRARVIEPSRLVNLKGIADLYRLDFSDEGGLVVGALVSLDEIGSFPAIRQHYRLLAEAIDVAASPQLRNVATMAGNLCQTSRCWYYRGPFFCWLKGGDRCYAETGLNQTHAIFGDGPCHSAHPSDPAPALIALGAELTIYSRDGSSRAIPVEQFFALPEGERRRATILKPDELVGEIRVPTPSEEARGVYLKAMPRETWAFSLASVAVQGTWDGPVAREVNIVLGGVAPIPWRVVAAESVVRDQPMSGDLARDAGEAALVDASPLQHNGYKLQLARHLVERALLAAASTKRQKVEV